PSTMCRSVRHTAHASTRISTSSGPGSGRGRSESCSGWRGDLRTMARMPGSITPAARGTVPSAGGSPRGGAGEELADEIVEETPPQRGRPHAAVPDLRKAAGNGGLQPDAQHFRRKARARGKEVQIETFPEARRVEH